MGQMKIFRVSRTDLPEALRGSLSGFPVLDTEGGLSPQLSRKEIGVGVWEGGDLWAGTPNFIVIDGETPREFYAWINTYMPEAAPISQWCRVVPLRELHDFFVDRPPHNGLGTTSAAWVGAVIGECVAQAGKEDARSALNFSACTATYTYAAARAVAVWGGRFGWSDLAERIERCHALLSVPDRRVSYTSLKFVWEVLKLADDRLRSGQLLSEPAILLAACCRDLHVKRGLTVASLSALEKVSSDFRSLGAVDELSAEKRLMLVEVFGRALERGDYHTEAERRIAEFVIGFLAANVGGGWRNIDLAGQWSRIAPLAPVWFGVVHSLLEREIYGGGFGGLSRLVLRELEMPLHLQERPRADISIEELPAAVSSEATGERIAFRTVQSRTLSVELVPGVTTTVPLDYRRDTVQGRELSPNRQSKVAHTSSSTAPGPTVDDRIEWLTREIERINVVLDQLRIAGSTEQGTKDHERDSKLSRPKGRSSKLKDGKLF